MCKMLVAYRGETSTIACIKQDFPAVCHELGIEVIFSDISDLNENLLKSIDSVMFVRVMDSALVKLIDQLRNCGIFTIAYYDDDLMNLPDTLPSIKFQQRAMKKILSKVDAVLTSSPKLKDKYYALSNGRCYLMHTAVEKEILDTIPQNNSSDKFRIVYAAGSGHAANIEKYISPFLKELFDRFGNILELEFIGVKPKIEANLAKNIIFTPAMPIDEWRAYMRQSKFDLGLAVLDDDEFSQCKYFNKYMEYSLAGIVGCYSNVEPYTYAVRDGENGFLAYNSPEEWQKKLDYIISNRNELKKCRDSAVEDLYENHRVSIVAKRLKEDMPRIVEKKAKYCCPSLKAFYLEDKVWCTITRLYLYGWHIKRDGFTWIKNGVLRKVRK